MNLDDLKNGLILIAIIVLIAAAAAIGMQDFQDEQRDTISQNETTTITNQYQVTLNGKRITSVDRFQNSSYNMTSDISIIHSGQIASYINVTNTNASNGTYDVYYSLYDDNEMYNITINGLLGADNATQYMDTIGTILGVAVLIGIVITAFYLFSKK